MKAIVGILGVIILGMVTVIVMGGNNDTVKNDSSVEVEKTVSIKQEAPQKRANSGGMPLTVEHCNMMPGMKGCKEVLEKSQKMDMPSSSIIVINNNQKLGELPMDEGKVEIIFEIQNTGDEDIILGEANGSCFCTQGYITDLDGSNKSLQFNNIGEKRPTNINRIIKAGEKQIVTAVYDPEAHGPDDVGPTTRGLTIKTNSKTTPNIRLDFFGTVVKTRSK